MKHSLSFVNIHFGIALLLLSTFFNIVVAQSDSISKNLQEHTTAKNPYSYRTKVSLLVLGAGVLSTANHGGTLNVTIPYETMDVNGVKTAHTFYGSSNNLFSNQSPEITFGIDLSRPHYVFNFTTGFNTSYKGAFYSVGLGGNLYIGHKGDNRYETPKKCTWVLRPSLNMTFFSFSSGSIGSITNTNTTIYILDREVGPTFEYFDFPRNKFRTTTVDAENLVISYKQKQIGLQPKIALCTNPYKKKYCVQLFASYFIPIFESNGLLLRQYSDGESHRKLVSGSSTNNLRDKNEIQASYNNRAFTSTPFHANYFYFGISLGFTFQN